MRGKEARMRTYAHCLPIDCRFTVMATLKISKDDFIVAVVMYKPTRLMLQEEVNEVLRYAI